MAVNKIFNFEHFAISMIKSIDMLSSKGVTGAKGTTESRINAFYRGLGLPAVMGNENAHTEEYAARTGSPLIDPKNTANNFFGSSDINVKSTAGLLNSGTVAGQLAIRERAMWAPTTSAELETFLDSLNSGVISSLPKDAVDENEEPRRRGTLFPMLVNGSIHIFPQSKRVGPAFAKDEDLVEDKIKYHRPLIETILSMRLTGQGVTDSTSSVTTTINTEIAKISEDIKYTLTRSTRNVSKLIDLAVRKANNARKYTGQTVNLDKGNQPGANPSVEENQDKQGQTEEEKKKAQTELYKQQARLAIFNFDDTSSSGEQRSRNLRSPAFASYLVDVLIGGASKSGGTKKVKPDIDKNISEIEKRLKKHQLALKQAYNELDLVLGNFSGISGTDIMAILIALFTVNTDVLIGLLNDEGQKNLKDAVGIGITAPSMTTAVAELQNEVVRILTAIHEDILASKHKLKKSNQKEDE